MRRLATHARGDSVKSNRDYQEIVDLGSPIDLNALEPNTLAKIQVRYELDNNLDLANVLGAIGGYIASDGDMLVNFSVHDDSETQIESFEVPLESQRHWTRFGHAWQVMTPAKYYTVSIMWQGDGKIFLWGLNCDLLRLPNGVQRLVIDAGFAPSFLTKGHLAPESFYLQHDAPLCQGIIIQRLNARTTEAVRSNPGKKCSQCQRSLPVDPRLQALRNSSTAVTRSPTNMVLAFHGHKAKRTGYQNECRACKKFEINDHFNPRRTSDQLYESSVLTRERKLFLRESNILDDFKNRVAKEGLRHFIWERFGRKCFKCGISVSLGEFELDHTRPLSYLWPIDQHATCLCADCNNRKKDSFPCDFYSPEDLQRLAVLIQLDLDELKVKSVNVKELERIRADICTFAESWTPRLFNSIAIRVRELCPEIDLFEELKVISPKLHKKISVALKERPAPVDDLVID